MDHHFRLGAGGRVEGYLHKYYYGRRPTGFYVPRFRNLNGERRDYLRGFGYQGAASREGWNRDVAELGIGPGLKDALSRPRDCTTGMVGSGAMLARRRNRTGRTREVTAL